MKNKYFRIFSGFLAVLLLALQLPINAFGASIAESVVQEIMADCLEESSANDVNEWIDTVLTENVGDSAEWYVIALSRYDAYDFGGYLTALENYLSENELKSAATRQKIALAMISLGENAPEISAVLDDTIGQQGIMSYIYGLHLLNNGCESQKFTQMQVIDELIALQLDDGGFAVMGTNGDADTTAMIIQSLAKHYESNDEVRSCVDGALAFLSEKQNASGDFSSYGVPNCESTAQVLLALSCLGIDAATDNRFIKNGNTLFDAISQFALDSGYSHTTDSGRSEMATVQVLTAMISYILAENGENAFYDFENAKTQTPDIEENAVTTAVSSEIKNETSDLREKDNVEESNGGYKLYVGLAIAFIGAAICVALYIFKGRNVKNCAVVLAITAFSVCIVLLTDIKFKDNVKSQFEKENAIGTVRITVMCDEIAENRVILENYAIEIGKGETVYDILLQTTQINGIHLDSEKDSSVYVKGIDNIYEFDYGALSGWVYYVNGKNPSISCSEYELSDGDEIVWKYTLAKE